MKTALRGNSLTRNAAPAGPLPGRLKPGSLAGLVMLVLSACLAGAGSSTPLRVGIAGMVHGHVNGFLKSIDPSVIEVVGVAEANSTVTERYADRYQLDPAIVHGDLTTMLTACKPEAVWVFSSTFDHLKIVQECAPRGVHVVVEKPLAVSLAHAQAMAELARNHEIHLLTNLETSWYPSLHEAYRRAVTDHELGRLNRIVSHFGHEGPSEIGVQPEFLSWLQDPVLNGGGASADFGCYGANLMTWIMGNQRPVSVMAFCQTNQTELYPRVDDQATILVEYPGVQGIIQASWCWPFPRKDVHFYGSRGAIRTLDPDRLMIRQGRKTPETLQTASPMAEPYSRPLEYFRAVIHGEIDPSGSLSSLENNLIAVEIMAAAAESVASGCAKRFPHVGENP